MTIDGKIELFARWVVKRSRGLIMPYDLVMYELYAIYRHNGLV